MLTKPKKEIGSSKVKEARQRLFLVSPKLTTSERKKFVKSKKPRKQKRVPRPSVNLTSWNTTDEDEIERRRFRAQTERLKYQMLEPRYDYFGSFSVSSEGRQTKYTVEIRSLNEHINSCDCPDYRWNQLGTCKHIEYVLWRLQKNRKKQFKEKALGGSPRIEIYLDRRGGADTLQLAFPKKLKKHIAFEQLQSFFNPEGVLPIHLMEVSHHIQSFLTTLKSRKIKNNIRLSRHLQDLIERETLKKEMEQKNTLLLQELSEKKDLLKGLKFPLYPYQEQGMLHLALNRRAL